MKKLLLLLTVCTAALCASASNRYVSPTGNDGDGKSWENAVTTIALALPHVGVGDTMFIAEGVYNESISAHDGATYLGGYNAETGVRDPELYETILDGTGLTSWLVVKYMPEPSSPITFDGLIFQNANHSEWGGAVMYMRTNMFVNNCVFRNNTSGSKAGGIFVDQSVNVQSAIRNSVFENCKNTLGDQAAAISCEENKTFNVLVENCIIRNCSGDVMIYSRAGMTVQNCVVYNNHSSKNGCLYGKGTFINNTVCNNTGIADRFAGARVDGKVVNCVFWGNQLPKNSDGTDPKAEKYNYAASGSNNIADIGSGMTNGLNSSNAANDGPNFRNPTGFAGLPKTDAEKLAVKEADFSISEASEALVDKGLADGAPKKDINGVDRPKGKGVDIGAYEYDPDAVHIDVTGVKLLQESVEIFEGRSVTLIAQVEPADANNKRVNWSIDDETVATIKNGKVTAVKEGTTIARVETQEGGFKASATVVVKPAPPIKYPKEVVEANEKYKMGEYTIPSFIEFLVAKQEASIDSMGEDVDLTIIPEKVAAMQEKIKTLVGKEEPYNLIATFNGDPKTHMGFCWFTNDGIKDGMVQLIAGNATKEDFETCDCVKRVQAEATTTIPLHYTPIQGSETPKYDICTAAGLPRNTKFTYVSHKALAEDLKPGTVYSWRAGYEGHWSDVYQFRTQEEEQGNFSFVYMSDSHIHNAKYIASANQCAKALAKNEPDVKFCVFPGDFVETGGNTNSEWQWERWFEGAIKPTLMKMAIVPTGGNHDVSDNVNYDYHFNTSHNFYEFATTKPQFHGVTYSFVYGDVLFLVYSLEDWWRAHGSSESGMESSYLSTDVANWFKQEIAKYPNTKYRVTLTHKNLFSGADHHIDEDAPLLRAMMLPVLKECGIDLAIQGHDHCYEVIGPVDPDKLTVVEGAITDRDKVSGGTEENMTGYEGGTFTTDKGTLYFIGATCGEKRYGPSSKARLESQYTDDPALLFDDDPDTKFHNVKNYYDLFTSKFGQPQTPSYSRFNVTSQYIEVITYKTDANGNKTVFNTIRVKNSRPSSMPESVEKTSIFETGGQKFLKNGQLFIRRNGRTFNVLGNVIAQ